MGPGDLQDVLGDLRHEEHADLLVGLGRSDDAEVVTLLHRYPLANGNDTILAGMEKALLAANDSIGALLVLQRLAEAPTSAAPLVSLAMLYMAAHRPALAAAELTRAIAIDPQDTAAITGLGEAKLALGEKAEAIVLFRRALALDPNDSTARNDLGRIDRR